MPATTFEVHVSIDDWKLPNKYVLGEEREQIVASFQASLDHWIAEQRLALKAAS